MNTTLQIRTKIKTKTDARKVFEKMGVDMSTAINLFLNQVIVEKGIPFTITQNTETIKKKWDKERAEALKNGKRYTNIEFLLKDLSK